MEVQIEKNIPFPDGRGGKGYTAALRMMQIGDSFVIEKKARYSVYKIASTIQPAKFATRTMPDGLVRLWRVA